MFTKITLENFMSFESISLDLSTKKNTAKKLAVIYGENGSGKTTLTQVFAFLSQTLSTMHVREILNSLLKEQSTSAKEFYQMQDELKEILNSGFSIFSLERIISDNKTIGSHSNMVIEYSFVLDGSPGIYYLEMDESSIVRERLEYRLTKRKSCYFDLEKDNFKINPAIFKTKEFYNTITNQAQKYWGKHTLLSILNFELTDKSTSFIENGVTENLLNVLYSFLSMYCYVPRSKRIRVDNCILDNLQKGTVSSSEEKVLLKVEDSLNTIFKSIYSDINRVYYKKICENEKISYELYFRKTIGNNTIDIEFDRESSGTKEILRIIPALVAACAGHCVIIDEYGVRIHDLLSEQILNSILNQITGQLIITTHNTTIMECSNLPKESLYFIKKNRDIHNKSIECITVIEKRLHPNHKYRDRYYDNELYAAYRPETAKPIDLSELVEISEK